MTQEELDAIISRDKDASCAGQAQKDRRSLLAEVDRLRRELENIATGWAETTGEGHARCIELAADAIGMGRAGQ